ncbi:MAG: hypothetical protein U1F08_02710 [Steroidobacteraceae bacterium]
MQQFLRTFLDIVLWRRGPQDLPDSSLLVWLAAAAYVATGALQLVIFGGDTAPLWLFYLVGDPLLLAGYVWLMLAIYRRPERFRQAAAAVFGTGALLGVLLYIPAQLLIVSFGLEESEMLVGIIALGLVVVFALVTGRIVQHATEATIYTGIASALVYFLFVNWIIERVQGGGA